MSSFYENIARMKELYKYGNEVNESKDLRQSTLEYHAIASDGKSYGILREGNKYYIKSAPKDKEMVSEAYNYIGGFCNKKNYEYTSYANAFKQFEMKMHSINEACEGNIVSSLDSFKNNVIITEGTQKMQDEIARCRQIMHNVSMIMNEASEIGASRKGDVVKYNGTNPEAETGKKGDEGNKKATANPAFKGTKTNGVNKKAAPFNKQASVSEGKCCEKCGKENCCCNEEAGDIGDSPLMPNTENWGTEGIGKGRDPKSIGWEIDGQKQVNEEENDWASKGLPSSPGVGKANTKHNNGIFSKSINESDLEDSDFENDETENFGNDNFDSEGNENFGSDDFESEEGDEFGDENDDDFNIEIGDENDDEFGDESDEFGDENDDEFGDESDEFGDEGDDEFGDESDEFGDESDDEFGDESDEFGDESDEFGDESDDEFGDETDEFGDESDDEFGDESDEFGDENDDEFGDESDEFGDENELNESKKRRLNRIVESVVDKIIKEDELHVFGKHPGYRKKPMELPTTGQDKNQWGEDWNDESVYSEQPFGEKIGDGDPFNNLVNAVTDDVMYQLKHGEAFGGKKKVR